MPRDIGVLGGTMTIKNSTTTSSFAANANKKAARVQRANQLKKWQQTIRDRFALTGENWKFVLQKEDADGKFFEISELIRDGEAVGIQIKTNRDLVAIGEGYLFLNGCEVTKLTQREVNLLFWVKSQIQDQEVRILLGRKIRERAPKRAVKKVPVGAPKPTKSEEKEFLQLKKQAQRLIRQAQEESQAVDN